MNDVQPYIDKDVEPTVNVEAIFDRGFIETPGEYHVIKAIWKRSGKALKRVPDKNHEQAQKVAAIHDFCFKMMEDY